MGEVVGLPGAGDGEKKRGRPPKNPATAAPAAEKKKRGRPPKDAKTNGAAKPKAAEETSPDVGHNSKIKKADVRKSFERLDKLHDEMESSRGEYMSDINQLYDEAANNLNVKRKNFRATYKKHRKALAEQRKEAGRETEDQHQCDVLQVAATWAGSPLAKAATERERVAELE